MAPDLNSLPPSRSMSSSPLQARAMAIPPPRRDTPSPRSSSVSLAAAASLNAAEHSLRPAGSNSRGSPRLGRAGERRRSQVAMNLNLNDPTLPAPGELSSSDHRTSIGHSFSSASPASLGGTRTIADGDPHHQRTPSLGEIHQELEQEQEAQVNRMLHMIRDQQLRLEEMQRLQSEASISRQSTAVLDEPSPFSERSDHLPHTATAHPPASSSVSIGHPTRRSSLSPHPRPHDLGSSHHPADHLASSPHALSLLETATVRRNSNSLRDESAYYQAETASLTRENQMLRLRIRELERQLAESSAGSGGEGRRGRGSDSNAPAVPSPLVDGTDKADP